MSKGFLSCAVTSLLAFAAPLRAATPVRRPQTGMAMKPVICRVVNEARGKAGEDLAAALESDAVRMAASNYDLAAIAPTEPPIACYRSRADPSKLPRGAR